MKLINLAIAAGLCLALSGQATRADESPLQFLQAQAMRDDVTAPMAGKVRRAPVPPNRPYGVPTFIRGRFVCAANLNRLLAHRGKAGTGSNLAMSFLSWGVASGPRPGAVQVERRRGGGHVKLVSHHDGSRWLCLNPSVRSQEWRVVPCASRNIIAWRVA
jgi:hypothetical protein